MRDPVVLVIDVIGEQFGSFQRVEYGQLNSRGLKLQNFIWCHRYDVDAMLLDIFYFGGLGSAMGDCVHMIINVLERGGEAVEEVGVTGELFQGPIPKKVQKQFLHIIKPTQQTPHTTTQYI